MTIRSFHKAGVLVLVVLPVVLVFLAGRFASAPGTYVYVQRNLASDPGGPAPRAVPKLVDPWGIAQAPSGVWWVASRRDGVLLAVSGKGEFLPESIVTIPSFTTTPGLPARPTGLVYNDTQDFVLGTGKPARLIVATQDGVIAAWNPESGEGRALAVADNSAFAVYTGITMGEKDGKHYLFAANFRSGTIDIFDSFFQQQDIGENAFSDPAIPEDYAPYNVLFWEERLYVLYALQDSERSEPASGVGERFVFVYDTEGRVVNQLAAEQAYRSAWSMAIAPEDFGRYAGTLLLGNTGNGTIAAVDPDDGTFKGLLVKPDGWLVTIPGLRGIAIASAGKRRVDKLYFAAGLESGEHGLFGYVMPQP